MPVAIEFPDRVIDRLHILWGEGFLSPGGRQEVLDIVSGLDLKGQRILDIGCGTAGAAIVLAGELGARQVVGVDVEPGLLDRASRHVRKSLLLDRIKLKQVKPGPLPFPDGCFDVVFSKDSIFHIADKEGLFREVARLLHPAGVFAASDWLARQDAGNLPEFARYLALRDLAIPMVTVAYTTKLMRRAGLTNVAALDCSSRYAQLLRRDADEVAGPLRSRLLQVMGDDELCRWTRLRRACAEAVCCGGLCPTRLRASSAKCLPAG